MRGKLLGIAITTREGVVATLTKAMITPELGVEGDLRGRTAEAHEKVVVLSEERWREVCKNLQVNVHWVDSGANLYVRGLQLGPDSKGRDFVLGSLHMVVTGPASPPATLDEKRPGLAHALSTGWRAGVTCSVLHGGVVRKKECPALYVD
jgi:MOSC domain-containing protein YiiM